MLGVGGRGTLFALRMVAATQGRAALAVLRVPTQGCRFRYIGRTVLQRSPPPALCELPLGPPAALHRQWSCLRPMLALAPRPGTVRRANVSETAAVWDRRDSRLRAWSRAICWGERELHPSSE
jgi:hypothetical protein